MIPYIHKLLRKRLLEQKGMIEHEEPTGVNLESRYKTEWSPMFERLMRNRLVMGSLRYRTFSKRRQRKADTDFAKEATRRLAEYQRTGNKEFLVDAANMCLMEFEFPLHSKAHFDNEATHNIHVKLSES